MAQLKYPSKKFFLSFTSITFSNLIVNLSTFAVMAIAPLKLNVDGFASLSLASSSAMVLCSLTDFGLNVTIVKKYSESKSDGFLDVLLAIKGLLFAIGILALFFSFFAVGVPKFWLIAFAAGVSLNYWTGLRTCEQAQQNYTAYASANFRFAAIRLAAGSLAVYTGSWVLVLVAVYVIPPAFAAINDCRRFARRLNFFSREKFTEVATYSKIVFVSSVCFAAMPYLPQYLMHQRLSTTEVATYGLIITFIGPVSLVAYSLRTLLLPKMCQNENFLVSMFSSRREVVKLISALVGIVVLIVAVALCIDALYGAKYPKLFSGFITFSIPYLLTAVLGLFNMRLHALGAPHLEMKVNIFRLLALSCIVYAWGTTFNSIVFIAAMTIFLSEVVLTYAVWKARLEMSVIGSSL